VTYLARIADRVLNRPLLIHPRSAETILRVLGNRIGVADDQPWLAANQFFGQPKGKIDPESGMIETWYRIVDGAAVIPVVGELVNRGAWIGAASGLVSYEALSAQLAAAMADPDVKSIVLDIESPGGEAFGIEALANQVRAARSVKPVVALTNDMAASAAYWLAAQADAIVASPTSLLGSIGVVLLHVDQSGRLEQAGLKPTLIFAGAHKVDGNSFGPLPDSVRADLQREVMIYYTRFTVGVGAGRGERLPSAAAQATEARSFIGEEAVAAGLADRIGSLAEAVALATSTTIPAPTGATASRRAKMANEPTAAPEAAGISQADHDRAVADARTASATAERDRITAILADAKVKGRERAALDLAMKSPAMSAADVAAFVDANVPAANAEAQAFADRLAANAAETAVGLKGGKPKGATASIDASAIFAARAAAAKSQ
jgi:signal peptide peptidase SppA